MNPSERITPNDMLARIERAAIEAKLPRHQHLIDDAAALGYGWEDIMVAFQCSQEQARAAVLGRAAPRRAAAQ